MIQKRNIRKNELLLKMNLAFTNAQVSSIFPALESIGYTKAQLNGYLRQIKEVESLSLKQINQHAKKQELTHQLTEQKKELDAIYKKDLAFARVFFKENVQATTTLELKGTRKRTYDSWYNQIANFYNQIAKNNLFLEKMAVVGVTSQKINQVREHLKNIALIKEEQKKKMGDAQKATEKCDEIINELSKHYDELIQLAKIVLGDRNQLLESLGIVVKEKK